MMMMGDDAPERIGGGGEVANLGKKSRKRSTKVVFTSFGNYAIEVRRIDGVLYTCGYMSVRSAYSTSTRIRRK